MTYKMIRYNHANVNSTFHPSGACKASTGLQCLTLTREAGESP